ncbi:phytanoyl-CoA dioxygenase family protein [Roseibium sp.]|uniref:phytanoyl-CoA dioxygenase family protein n=1 Tax=Roseibium sp. TaxID=1936156 RepID=UPI003A974BD2
MDPYGNRAAGYYLADDCDLNDLAAFTARALHPSDVEYASEIQKNIPIYDVGTLRPDLADADRRRALMSEWAHVLLNSAGVLVLKNAYPETSALDDATGVYEEIIAAEKAVSGGGADHFAAAGKNDRVWNSLQKLCEASPQTFIDYFSNPAIDAVCEAWLGPGYQMTAQVNLVYPGGAAQLAHRDYHLGFQTADVSAAYPIHVHDLSPVLTLQGAIAHCDMPLESGPTKLLPFSQLYRPGYAAWRRDDFRAHFEEHYVQLPLEKGDAVFFNPALLHAAGANVSQDIHRLVNLLQVSSAFGRAMETVDRLKMCRTLYPHIRDARRKGELPDARLAALIATIAEGYSFPTNLDRDPPVDGLAPETQQALMLRAVQEDWTDNDFHTALDAQEARRKG